MFNGVVWNNLFKGYREFWSYYQTIDSLEDDRVRLQLRIDELENGYKLDGLDVVVTMYHPVKHQTDGTPNIKYKMELRLQYILPSEYKYVLSARNLF